VAIEPRIVHEHINAPVEELGRPRDGFLDSVLVTHVGLEGFASALERSDLARRCTGVLKIENGDVRAFGGEGPSNVTAKAGGGAGDQHVLLRKAHRRQCVGHRL
jgi:hypothetical protein